MKTRGRLLVVLVAGLLGVSVGCGEKCPSHGTTSCGSSAKCIGNDEMEDLVREYVFKKQPDMNPTAVFVATELDVPDLWEEMNLQIFDVQFMSSDGQQFNESPFIYHDGVVEPFACYGMASGAVSEGALYYSFAWGEAYRSHVARLSWNTDDCTLRTMDSGGFRDVTLLVYPHGNEMWVDYDPENYTSFNSWESAKRFGRVEESNGSLVVIDENGKIVEPDFSALDHPCCR
jgi:hypothetical protein